MSRFRTEKRARPSRGRWIGPDIETSLDGDNRKISGKNVLNAAELEKIFLQ